MILNFITILLIAHAGAKVLDKRMVNGRPGEITDVPYLVFISSEEFSVCAGTIISTWNVLTAGHCTRGDIELITIRSGSSYRNRGGVVHSATHVWHHPNFSVDEWGQASTDDLAVIQVAEPFAYDATTQPIRLPEHNWSSAPGSPGLASSWGRDEHGFSPAKLKHLKMRVIERKGCNAVYASWGGLRPGQFCARSDDPSKYPCYGDSGGPLVMNGELVGVSIYGGECELHDSPSVFTDVAYFRDWIDQYVMYD